MLYRRIKGPFPSSSCQRFEIQDHRKVLSLMGIDHYLTPDELIASEWDESEAKMRILDAQPITTARYTRSREIY